MVTNLSTFVKNVGKTCLARTRKNIKYYKNCTKCKKNRGKLSKKGKATDVNFIKIIG